MDGARVESEPHVVIVGGGFGGLACAKALARRKVLITLVDRTNHHLFQPLLYQVAVAGLSPADIASPIRAILRAQKNVRVQLAEVTGIDLRARKVRLETAGGRADALPYDVLVLATGAKTSYFGHDRWAKHAPGLKGLADAIEIRRRVLLAFEQAECESDPARRRRLLTFVSIGGGPTGVEMAGAIAEIARFALARDFRTIDPKAARVILVEAGDRILASFDPPLSARAVEQLAELGVDVRVGTRVTDIDAEGVHVRGPEGGDQYLETSTVVWAAGVRATALTSTLGVGLDRMGRVIVEPDLTIPGHPEAFVIGDAACFTHQTGGPLPGVSPVAIQMGRAVARQIASMTARPAAAGEQREPFRYFDKGNMATIGRSRAIAQVRSLRLSGFVAWVAWLVVHIWYLIGFRNRVAVMLSWGWSYITYGRGARLITTRIEQQPGEGERVSTSRPG